MIMKARKVNNQFVLVDGRSGAVIPLSGCLELLSSRKVRKSKHVSFKEVYRGSQDQE